jgi:DNA-binding NarL/FixJ family response regulator
VRFAVADDQPIFRLGVRTLLDQDEGFTMVAEAGDVPSAIAILERHTPDVLLLGHSVPRLNALDVLRHLKASRCTTRAIVVTASITDSDIEAALVLGAWGVIMKSALADGLPECVRQVLSGELWVGVESVSPLISSLRAPATGGSPSLTPRELDIVRRVARGASNKDIAWQLHMGEQTVKNHLRRIFRKLHVANRVELALLAVENELTGGYGGSAH